MKALEATALARDCLRASFRDAAGGEVSSFKEISD